MPERPESLSADGPAGEELDLDASAGKRGEFCLSKGLALSLVAGVLSAVYGLALELLLVANLAEKYGAGIWKGNVSYLFVNTGAFLTSLLYSLYLARRNRSIAELARPPAGHGMHILRGTTYSPC